MACSIAHTLLGTIAHGFVLIGLFYYSECNGHVLVTAIMDWLGNKKKKNKTACHLKGILLIDVCVCQFVCECVHSILAPHTHGEAGVYPPMRPGA